MKPITGSIPNTENIDFKLYVQNVLSLLPDDVVIRVSTSRPLARILADNYLPVNAGTNQYRNVAEEILCDVG